MKKPGTTITWKDLSGRNTKAADEALIRPILLAASSFDKGPEGVITVHGDQFYKLFGDNISFAKHGQPAIQAANSIDAGAELLIKRIVAEDATLANLIVVAELSNLQTPKVDQTTGLPVYIDKDTQQETDQAQSASGEANERAMINTCNIKYDVVTVEGAKTFDEVKAATKNMVTASEDNSTFRYPLFIITDNGRGKSSKRVNFGIDYSISKNAGFPMYQLVHLGAVGLDYEYVRFAGDPDTIYLNRSYSLSMTSSDLDQIQASETDNYAAFIAKVAEFSGIDEETLGSIDILFGCDLRGNKIPQITIDSTGYDLAADYGLALQSGTNGSFGDAPFGTEEYATEMVKFFDGTFDPVIFDRDRYEIAACVDANYPLSVKKAITDLANFREDFIFLRDIGLGNNTYDAIVLAAAALDTTKFAATYIQTYDVVDKFTKRQVTVTIGYSLARLIVDHLNYRPNAPFCGILYDITIPEAIENTVNFLPIVTPNVDQKSLLVDKKLNYASYINNVLTVELQLTSQDNETQCSHINNIIAVQEVIRDIRATCPRIRYSFIDRADGLTKYANDVKKVIDRHSEEFKSIEFEWTSDDVQLANKIFNATLYVSFKDYVQSEAFTICTID